jgi:hypothetical protein
MTVIYAILSVAGWVWLVVAGIFLAIKLRRPAPLDDLESKQK